MRLQGITTLRLQAKACDEHRTTFSFKSRPDEKTSCQQPLLGCHRRSVAVAIVVSIFESLPEQQKSHLEAVTACRIVKHRSNMASSFVSTGSGLTAEISVPGRNDNRKAVQTLWQILIGLCLDRKQGSWNRGSRSAYRTAQTTSHPALCPSGAARGAWSLLSVLTAAPVRSNSPTKLAEAARTSTATVKQRRLLRL